jgi:hypothetical protein
MIWALLLGCPPTEGVVQETSVDPMSDVDLLIRASLDLRGRRPTVAEIERVEADPAELDAILDGFAADPAFGARVADLWSEIYLTRSETWPVQINQLDVDVSEAELVRSLGEEPLQIVKHVADNDLPYTELVTADWTMANEVTAAIWPIERPSGEGWQVSRYTDGRPAAGVLSTNTMWWRYTSTDSNANRKRANQTSRIFLCHDYLHRPIEFDRNVNLLDEAALSDALRNNPACVNCHVSLDPIASYYFGFWWYTDSVAEISTYHPDRELRWKDYGDVPPAWYGVPGDNLADLGQQIAGDNRFAECAVEQAYELLLRREVTLQDEPNLTAIREEFLAGGMTHRALLRAVVDTPEYRSGATEEVGYVPRKMLTPDLLADSVEDLTGFRWTNEGWDLLESDTRGFRTLAGGADGYSVTRNADTPNATIVLVQERLAEAAAAHVVAHDAEEPEKKLFTEIDFTETPETGREAMVAQLVALHLRLFGHRVAADGPEIAANLELWSDLYAIDGDAKLAWTGVLSALLRDPDFLLY